MAFQLPDQDSHLAAPQVRELRSVAGLEALLALQGVDDIRERRRRSLKRGNRLLDGLEALKIALLEGRMPTGELNRLKVVAQEAREESGDAGLDQILGDIELRVAVELAKRGPRAVV